MTFQTVKATFARGELSPRLHGRIDIDHYRMGLEECVNFHVMRQGGITRRPGTVFVSELKDSEKPARLMPFVFNEQQAYVVEIGHRYCRFYALDGRVEADGGPYEITHSYNSADVNDIHFAQSADVLYLAHGDYEPAQLTRKGETQWDIAPFVPEDGPYLEENRKATSLTLLGNGAPNPSMTSNSTPTGYAVAASNGSANAWKVFDGDPYSEFDLGSIAGAWVEIEFDQAKAVDGYIVSASRTYPDRHPISWTIQGYDAGQWISLQRVNNETGWNRGESRSFTFPNERGFAKYRLLVHATGDNNNAIAGSLLFHWVQDQQSSIVLNASSINGINSDAGFLPQDVNRSIRIYGSDGIWRWCKIRNVLSNVSVEVELGDQALKDLEPIFRWKMSAWSAQQGYPSTVAFYNERLAWAGSQSFPRSVWFSEIANYQSHRVSDPLVDSDAVNVSMTGGQINKIQWVHDIYDLAAGTTQSIRSVGSATSNLPFSAGNVEQRQQTTIGSSNIQPLSIGETTIYADYFRKRLHEFTYSFELNGYQAPELSVLSDHVFKAGITSFSYQSVPDNLIWVGLKNGQFGCVAFEKNQAIVGISRVAIAGGNAGDGIVESHCIVPTEQGDRLWMTVRRTINGSVRRTVEYLAEPYETGDLAKANYLDAALRFEGPGITQVNGLDHLEGETVGIFADGVDIGDVQVLNGEITLPDGITAERLAIGLRYQSQGKTLRMAHTSGSGSSTFGRKKKVAELSFDVLNTGALKVGGARGQYDLIKREMGETQSSSKALISGLKHVKTQGSWAEDGQIEFHSDRAYPVTIRGIIATLSSGN